MEHSVEEISTTEIKTKMHFMGKVVKIALAGAMVELEGGRHGLLHISQLATSDDQPIKRVEDVLKEGQEIEVWVKKVVKQDGEDRVELTMIKPLDLEWRDIKKGMTVKGKVVRLEKFGAFVEIGAERPGLVHISEMAHGYVRTPGDVVKEGDEIEAEVIDVNRRKKQIKLSMKALLPEPVKVEEAPRPAATEPAPRRERPASANSGPNAGAAARRKKVNRKPKSEDGTDNSALVDSYSEPVEAEPTALGIALMEAMERAKSKKKQSDDKVRRSKVMTQEQEEILTRTLDNKPNS